MPGVIIPRKTVHELARLLEDTSAKVKVGVSQTKVRFEIGELVLTSKLIDGTFPDYGRVIPHNNDKELKVPNAAFMSAVDRVSTIASERGRAVKLNLARELDPDGEQSRRRQRHGRIAGRVRAAPLEIGFNARYLLDIAGQLEGDEASSSWPIRVRPTMVRDTGSEGALSCSCRCGCEEVWTRRRLFLPPLLRPAHIASVRFLVCPGSMVKHVGAALWISLD